MSDVVGPTPDGTFVGRALELARLQDLLVRARAGHPQVAIVEGGAGIGKTALVDVFTRRAGDHVVVLRARADDAERTLSLAVLGQLLARAALHDGQAPAGASGALPVGEQDPLASGTQLLAALGAVQADRDVVLVVVDDAHLADAPSTRALIFATRRLLADRVLLLLTTRPGELDAGWAQFDADGRGALIRLEGLSALEVRELAERLGVRMGTAQTDRLRRDTDGHPLYTRTLLVEADLHQRWLVDRLAPPPPPPQLAALVLGALGRCRPATVALVQAASVLGRHCRLTLAGDLAGAAGGSAFEAADLAAALDEAVSARLLTVAEQPAGRELRFPHGLVHAAVYEGLNLHGRISLHRQAAELTSGAVSLAHRLAATLGVDEDLAGAIEAMARRELEVGAWRAAAEHLRQASTVSGTTAAADRRVLDGRDVVERGRRRPGLRPGRPGGRGGARTVSGARARLPGPGRRAPSRGRRRFPPSLGRGRRRSPPAPRPR